MTSLPFGNLDDASLLQLKNSGQIDQGTYDSIVEMRGSQSGKNDLPFFKRVGISQMQPTDVRAVSAGPQLAPVAKPDIYFQDDLGKTIEKISASTQSKNRGGPIAGPIGQIQRGAAQYEAGVGAEATATVQQGEGESAVFNQAMEGQQRFDATYASIERRRAMAQQVYANKAEKLRSDADLMVRYPGIDFEEVKSIQEGIAKEESTYAQSTDGAERKTAAQNIKKMQARLVAGQEVDDSGGLTGGRRVMAAIAMALGAYGTALARTPNYAMQIVQAQIDRNVAAQKDAFARRGRAGEKQQTIADQMVAKKMAEYTDEFQQTQAAEAVYWQQAKRQLEQVAVRSKAPQARANAQKMAGDFEARIGEKIAAIVQRGEQIDMQRFAIESRQQKQPIDEFAATKADLRRLIGLREKYGSEHFGGDVQSTMQTLSKSLLFRIGALHNQKRMSDKDADILGEMIGNPTGYGWQKAKMTEALRIVEGIERQSKGQEVYSPENDPLLQDLGEPQ